MGLLSTLVQMLLPGWLSAFVYHLCNGIRHLTWDFGIGMEQRRRGAAAVVVLIVAVVLALAIALLLERAFARSAS